MTIARGWKAREAAAKAKLAARDAGYNIVCTPKEQARHALREAQAAEARAHQEARERAYRETVATCPCCSGKGFVMVIDGAAWLEAFERYRRVDWKPSPETIGLMLRRAFEVDRDGNRITAEVPAAPPSPVTPPIGPMINAVDDVAGSDEEALAAIQAEAAKPAKAQRKHVSPPFLDADG